jgi:hypothetical protein
MKHAWERWEIDTKFCSENIKGRDYLEDLCAYARITLDWILKNRLRGCRMDT